LVKKIEVRAFDENAIINIETDGELPGKLPATFEIVPKILKVRVPKK
jgi:diacylglycerol kinase family enzyme